MTRRTFAAAAVIVLLVAGCASDDRIGDAADAAVGVRASGCGLADRLGTGALVLDGDRTVVVTSAHTVAGSDTIVVERVTQRTAVELLAIDPARDLAVLAAPRWAITGRPLGVPEAGEPGRLAAWTPDDDVTVGDTEISRLLRVTIEDIYVQGEYERRAFEIDASIARGDSGAPVVADDGSVLGIVYARSRERGGVAFAVSATEIGPLIDRTGDTAVDSGRCV